MVAKRPDVAGLRDGRLRLGFFERLLQVEGFRPVELLAVVE